MKEHEMDSSYNTGEENGQKVWREDVTGWGGGRQWCRSEEIQGQILEK
jgi:hypothetical protein